MATISVFIGSTRTGRMGDKVAHWVVDALKARGHTVHVIDPVEHKDIEILSIPTHYNPHSSVDLKKISGWLNESDGFVLVTPEYNHSFSGALKNALDMFMPEYARKPFALVSYSASPFGGIRALEHLHGVVPELKGVATPYPLMVSSVGEVFGEDGKLKDQAYTKRLEKTLAEFEWYVDALKAKRK